jgi:8-oxo-dGTP pyrophosphatase MutT (NUDIX family)
MSSPIEHPDLKNMCAIMNELEQSCKGIQAHGDSSTIPLSNAELILMNAAQKITDTASRKWKTLATEQVAQVVTGSRTSAVDLIPIIISEEGTILSMPQFSKPGQDRYVFSGGKAHDGETAAKAVLREAEEELKLSQCLDNKKIVHPGYLTIMHVQSHPKHDARGLCSFPFVKFIVVDKEKEKEFLELDKKAELKGWFAPSDDFAGKVPCHFSYDDFSQLASEEGRGKLIGHMRFRQTLAKYLAEIAPGGKVDIGKIQNITDPETKIYQLSVLEKTRFTAEELEQAAADYKIKGTLKVNKEVVDKIASAFCEAQEKLENYQITGDEKIKWHDVSKYLLTKGDPVNKYPGLSAIIEKTVREKLGIDREHSLITIEAPPLYATYTVDGKTVSVPVPRHMSVEQAVAGSIYSGSSDAPRELSVTVKQLSCHSEGFTAVCDVV